MRSRTCWDILRVPPYSEMETVRAAFRALVRKHHPDFARTPERVRRNTLRCVKIISAYKEAKELLGRLPGKGFASPAPVGEEPEPVHFRANGKPSSVDDLGVAGKILGFAAFLVFFVFFVISLGWVTSLPSGHWLVVLLGSVASIGVGLIGGFVVGIMKLMPLILALDYLVSALPRRLTTLVKPYVLKAAWSLDVILSAAVSAWVVYDRGGDGLRDWQVVGAALLTLWLVPVWSFVAWFIDLRKYRQLERGGLPDIPPREDLSPGSV